MVSTHVVCAIVLAFPSVSGERLPVPQEVEDIFETVYWGMHGGNELQLAQQSHRRLSNRKKQGSIPDINYETACTSTCMTTIRNQFTIALQTLDNSTCKNAKNAEKAEKVKQLKATSKNGGRGVSQGAGANKGGAGSKGNGGSRSAGGRQLKQASSKQEASCIFDICSKSQITAMCALTSAQISETYEIDDCSKANVLFLCSSICSSSCSSDTNVKALMCGSGGDARGGSFDNQRGGSALKSMFNYMCSYNDAKGKYCYDMIKTEMASRKLEKNADATGFPDPCEAMADCSGDMGTSITSMGCCFPALMDAQKKYRIGKPGQIRMAKAIAKMCGNSSAFTSCASGNFTNSKSARFDLSLASYDCASLGDEDAEDSFVNAAATMLNLTDGDVQLLTCKAKGTSCSSRRMDDMPYTRRLSGADTSVDVTVSGDDADAQLAVIATCLSDSTCSADITATAGEASQTEVTQNGQISHSAQVTMPCGLALLVASMIHLLLDSVW